MFRTFPFFSDETVCCSMLACVLYLVLCSAAVEFPSVITVYELH